MFFMKGSCLEKLCGGKEKARKKKKKKLKDMKKLTIDKIESALLQQFDLKSIIQNLTFLMYNQNLMLKKLKIDKKETA